MEDVYMEAIIEKCECFVHSLNRESQGNLAEATIIRRVGDNSYLADYNGVKCTAIFNPFTGRYYVDDIYGVIPDSMLREHGSR